MSIAIPVPLEGTLFISIVPPEKLFVPAHCKVEVVETARPVPILNVPPDMLKFDPALVPK